MTIAWVILSVLGFGALLVVSQDIHIFPGALFSLYKGSKRDPRSLPSGIESEFVETADGKKLEVWRMAADSQVELKEYRALIFHGNGASLEYFELIQLWFSSLGIVSYSFDYRGYGKSTGWPSEKGIYQDGETVWKYVTERESVDADKMIIFGLSVGSAPAAKVAADYQPKVLMLVSAFTNLKQVVREQFLIGLLARFIWYKMPTLEYVKALRKTSLILAHGRNDKLIRPYHSELIRDAYSGSGEVFRIDLDVPGHNSIFYAARRELASKLNEMLPR